MCTTCLPLASSRKVHVLTCQHVSVDLVCFIFILWQAVVFVQLSQCSLAFAPTHLNKLKLLLGFFNPWQCKKKCSIRSGPGGSNGACYLQHSDLLKCHKYTVYKVFSVFASWCTTSKTKRRVTRLGECLKQRTFFSQDCRVPCSVSGHCCCFKAFCCSLYCLQVLSIWMCLSYVYLYWYYTIDIMSGII